MRNIGRNAKGRFISGHPDFVPESSRKEQGRKMKNIMKGRNTSPETQFKFKYGCKNHLSNVARKVIEERCGIEWKDMNKPKKAVIHHINGNRRDNRFENLCVMSASDHMRLHANQRWGNE